MLPLHCRASSHDAVDPADILSRMSPCSVVLPHGFAFLCCITPINPIPHLHAKGKVVVLQVRLHPSEGRVNILITQLE